MSRSGMLRSLFSTGAGTLVSRMLGLVRDVVIASVFGAGAGADTFFVAFRIPNFFRRLFGEGAFSLAFVPVLSEYRVSRSEDEVRDLVGHVAGTLGTVLLAVTAAGIVAAPGLVYVFASGFAAEPGQAALTASLLRLTFPYLLFISLTALAGGILNTWGRFAIPAVTPSLLNVAMIGAAIGLAPRFDEPVIALAWGVLAGGVAQLAFQLPFLWRIRMLVRPRLRLAHQGVRRIVRLIVPAVLGVSVAQVNLLVDTQFASYLAAGSISWLYYSDRLMEFPLGVFGIALATVALPSLAARHAEGDPSGFHATLDWALRLVLVIAVPAALGLGILSIPMIATVFQYGEFGEHAVRMSALSLSAYAGGLVAFVGVKVLAAGFHARQQMRIPVRIAVVAMVANVVLNFLLVGPFAHAGLALASSLAAWLNAGLLLRSLRKEGFYRPRPGWGKLFAQTGIAAAAIALVLAWFQGAPEVWMARAALDRAVWLGALVAAGAIAWFGALAAAGLRPRDLLRPMAGPPGPSV
ncbi:MAG: murein biosynthesis integral membrane protein MurJ [Immundisolibacterales bacterium]|nr:murein biosynthesis integral membrane protein MurJ [Immundisolibacterales bacterium]